VHDQRWVHTVQGHTKYQLRPYTQRESGELRYYNAVLCLEKQSTSIVVRKQIKAEEGRGRGRNMTSSAEF